LATVSGDAHRPAPSPTRKALGHDRDVSLAFAGAGRLGSSLAIAAKRAGYNVVSLSSRRVDHRQWLRARLPGVRVVASPAEAAARADIVFITTMDAAVSEVSGQVPWRSGQAAVHCAGALPLSVLNAAARAGVAVGSFHPLQTFPGPDAHDRLKGVSFAIESPDPALAGWLRGFATGLGGVPFDIAPQDRAAYHASAVMVSGLTAALAGLSAQMWTRFGVPRDRALASLSPLIVSTALAVRERGLPGALTGPFVRGDVETVAGHIEATAAQSPDLARAYAALALAALPLAAEQCGLSGAARKKLENMLRRALAATDPSTDRRRGVARSLRRRPEPVEGLSKGRAEPVRHAHGATQ
jgi:predicted short-subunit dehydrogenase-like oxidoreductase (DUF2520 family)